jgi:hypothetical protein
MRHSSQKTEELTTAFGSDDVKQEGSVVRGAAHNDEKTAGTQLPTFQCNLVVRTAKI